MKTSILNGEVYWIKFVGEGNVQKGFRPGVIFQNEVGNVKSPNTVAFPLTKVLSKSKMPTHVFVSAKGCGLRHDSIVLCENPQTISKTNLGSYITRLPREVMKEVAIAQLIATPAISYLDTNEMLKVWTISKRLNELAA